MLLRTARKSGKFFWSVGLIELLPVKKTYGSSSGNRERTVLDLKNLGLNVGKKAFAYSGLDSMYVVTGSPPGETDTGPSVFLSIVVEEIPMFPNSITERNSGLISGYHPKVRPNLVARDIRKGQP